MRINAFVSMTVFAFSIVCLSALESQAAQSNENVWEKVCATRGVSAACRKAGAVLEQRLLEAEAADEEASLRKRLLSVSRLGCDKGDVSSCAQLYFTEDTVENLNLAKDAAQKSCSAGKAESCKVLRQISEDAEGKKNENQKGVQLDRADEFLTARQ